MNLEDLRNYCLKKASVTEGLPFGEDTLVFKVEGKMFLLADIKSGSSFNVKCEPELAVELREKYSAVQPGYHMYKKLWNTVSIDGSLTTKQLTEMIDHSYEQVVKNLPKKVQDKIIRYRLTVCLDAAFVYKKLWGNFAIRPNKFGELRNGVVVTGYH